MPQEKHAPSEGAGKAAAALSDALGDLSIDAGMAVGPLRGVPAAQVSPHLPFCSLLPNKVLCASQLSDCLMGGSDPGLFKTCCSSLCRASTCALEKMAMRRRPALCMCSCAACRPQPASTCASTDVHVDGRLGALLVHYYHRRSQLGVTTHLRRSIMQRHHAALTSRPWWYNQAGQQCSRTHFCSSCQLFVQCGREINTETQAVCSH